MIEPISGPDLGVYHNENYVLHEMKTPEGARIVFSATQQGKALSCHFAAEKAALRHIKPSIELYVRWLFETCKWCRMIIAVIDKPSVVRVVRKLNFKRLGITNSNQQIYIRCRHYG